MSKKSEYFVGVDWAADPPAESQRLVDAIICDPSVKKQIEEALEQTKKSAKNPPVPEEITIPIKIMTIPGMDASMAYLISPAGLPRYNATRAGQLGRPNKNRDVFPQSLFGGSLGSMFGGSAAGAMQMQQQQQSPFFAYTLPGVGVANTAAIKRINMWGTPRFAEMGERCQTCENALICNVEKVSPVVCAGCKRRYVMYGDCEVETRQICLGFDWAKAKKDFQCDKCAHKVISKAGIP